MKGPTLKWQSTGRLRRTVLMLGLTAATAGGALLTAAAAQAVTGSEPGNLSLNPASGSSSLTPTWSTTDGCPAGFQTSAVLFVLNSDGSIGSSASPTVAAPTAAFSGTLLASVANSISLGTDVGPGGTDQWVVGCFAGPGGTGNVEYVQSVFVTLSADGSSYTTSASGPAGAVATTTTLTASPNPATVGNTVTLTATVKAADNTNPAGSVQFEANGTNIGTPVAVSGSGAASTTTSFAAAGPESLSAVFTPTNASAYNSSTGTYSETVQTASSNSGSEPIAVTVPATGAFTLTVAPGTVNLTASGSAATGALQPITVSDTRNTFPGWSVSGQVADFTGSGTAAGGTISGNQLGWTPTDTSLSDAQLGSPVTPASPGLGTTAAVLASALAGHGFGTSVLGANLDLAIPPSSPAGPYTSLLTVTAVTSNP